MKKYLLLSLIVFLQSYSIAQNYLWAKGFGGPGSDQSNSLAIDDSGNVYSTGFFSGTVDFDPGIGSYNLISKGGTDIFVSKLDSSGVFKWAISVGSIGSDGGTSVKLDSANIYITGYFQGSCDFDPGPGIASYTSAGMDDAFILKLSSAGIFQWAKTFGGVSSDAGTSLVIDSLGNIYSAGKYSNTADFDPGTGIYNQISKGNYDIFLLKLNSAGDFVWVRSMGGVQEDLVYDIAIDKSASLYLTGRFNITADFDPSASTFNLISAGSTDVFICKFDSSGSLIIAKSFGGTLGDQALSIAVDAIGNIYTIGNFGGTADFDPNSGISLLTSSGGTDVFISKLSPTGQYLWARKYGGIGNDLGAMLKIDGSGNIVAIGSFIGEADFNQGTNPYILNSSGSYDVFIAKINAASNLVWAKRLGGLDLDQGRTIAMDQAGNITSTGQFSGTADFDPGKWAINLNASGGTDVFVSKLGTCNLILTPLYNNLIKDIGMNIDLAITSNNPYGTYQWQQNKGSGFADLTNGGPYNGVTNDTLSITNLGLIQNTYDYRCIQKDGICIDTSVNINFNVCDFKIIKHPQDQNLKIGFSAMFIVGTTSDTAIYQWQQDIGTGFVSLTNTGQFSGVFNDTLLINNLTLSQNNYKYRAIAIDGPCTKFSNTATLSIINNSGIDAVLEESNIFLRPNPAKDFIRISISNPSMMNIHCSIYNSIGELVKAVQMDEADNVINIASLAGGIYFLRTGAYNVKFVKY